MSRLSCFYFQPVTSEIAPNTVCLSNDTAFSLMNGEGTFPGSICQVGAGVQLRFSVTDSLGNTHYTQWTTPITVTGINVNCVLLT